MKIFDCTTYFNEPLIMDVRFNVLDKYVEKYKYWFDFDFKNI